MLLPASRDPLTLLPSRSSFLLALELTVTESESTYEPLALFLMGIDHPSSDAAQENHEELMPTVAKLLRLVCGKSGLLGHIGQGLFGVLRRDLDQPSALALAESFRLAVELNFKSRKYPLTVSIGLARRRPFSRYGADAMLSLAERCCVESRECGGNQVHAKTLDPCLAQRPSCIPTNHSK